MKCVTFDALTRTDGLAIADVKPDETPVVKVSCGLGKDVDIMLAPDLVALLRDPVRARTFTNGTIRLSHCDVEERGTLWLTQETIANDHEALVLLKLACLYYYNGSATFETTHSETNCQILADSQESADLAALIRANGVVSTKGVLVRISRGGWLIIKQTVETRRSIFNPVGLLRRSTQDSITYRLDFDDKGEPTVSQHVD